MLKGGLCGTESILNIIWYTSICHTWPCWHNSAACLRFLWIYSRKGMEMWNVLPWKWVRTWVGVEMLSFQHSGYKMWPVEKKYTVIHKILLCHPPMQTALGNSTPGVSKNCIYMNSTVYPNAEESSKFLVYTVQSKSSQPLTSFYFSQKTGAAVCWNVWKHKRK